MILLINTKNMQQLAIVATCRYTVYNNQSQTYFCICCIVKDICFNVLCKNQQWKDNNSWAYLHIITALFKIWLGMIYEMTFSLYTRCKEVIFNHFYATDCDNLTNIGPHLINEMIKYNDIDLNSNLPDYCIKDIIKCYLYQSEYVCTSSKNS